MQPENDNQRYEILSPKMNPEKYSKTLQNNEHHKKVAKSASQENKRKYEWTPSNSPEQRKKVATQSSGSLKKDVKTQQNDDKHHTPSASSNTTSPGKIRKTPLSGKFVNTMVGQWTKYMGIPNPLAQVSGTLEGPPVDELQEKYDVEKRKVAVLQKKLQQSENTVCTLQVSHDKEIQFKEEILTKLDANWEYMEIITKHCNDLSESLTVFQQLRTDLSTRYNAIEEGLRDMKIKVENQKKLISSKEKEIQELIVARNKMQFQLEQIEKNRANDKEKLIKFQEHEKTVLENEKLIERKNNQIVELTSKVDELLRCNTKITGKYKEKEEEATKQLQSKIEELRKLEQNLEAKQQMENELRLTISAMNEAFNNQKEELSSKLEELRNLQANLDLKLQIENDLRQNIITINDELNDLKEQHKSKLENLGQLQETLNTRHQTEQKLHNDINALNEEYNDHKEQLKSKFEEIQRLQDNLDTRKKIESNLRQDINMINEELNNQKEQLKTKVDEIQKLQENLDTRKKVEQDLLNDLESIDTLFKKQNERYKNLQSDYAEIERKLKEEQMRNTNLESVSLDQLKIHENKIIGLSKTIQACATEKGKILLEHSNALQILQEKHAKEVSKMKEENEKKLTEMQIFVQNSVLKEFTNNASSPITLRNRSQVNNEFKIIESSPSPQKRVTFDLKSPKVNFSYLSQKEAPLEAESGKNEVSKAMKSEKRFFTSRGSSTKHYGRVTKKR